MNVSASAAAWAAIRLAELYPGLLIRRHGNVEPVTSVDYVSIVQCVLDAVSEG